MEDEGTPPAEHEGFLSGDASPAYLNSRWSQRERQEQRIWPREIASKQARVVEASATEKNTSAVDLIMLLEENWYGTADASCSSRISRYC